MIYHNYVTVIGRLRGEDEDNSIESFEQCTTAEAMDLFKNNVAVAEMVSPNEDDVYVSHVITSDSPMTVMSFV